MIELTREQFVAHVQSAAMRFVGSSVRKELLEHDAALRIEISKLEYRLITVQAELIERNTELAMTRESLAFMRQS